MSGHPAGFSPLVVEAVKAITRTPGEDYAAYLERVMDNAMAVEVKMADILDNFMDLPESEAGLRKRYGDSLEKLRKVRVVDES